MTMTDDNTGGVKQNSDYNREYTLKDPDHDEIKDGYQLRWVGKNYAKLQENLRPETIIVPDAEHNAKAVNKDSKNLFLTGDNLEVLKHLEHSYTGKVDMIYIDPPYNTGSDGFVYSDNFRFTDDQLRDTLGLTEAEVKKIRNIYGKASHSAWLTFMYPRLKLAKKLLSDTGVIFISIDDNEQANLKLLMDEIFNEDNFIAEIIHKNNSNKNQSNLMSVSTEYMYSYARNKSALTETKWRTRKKGAGDINRKYLELKKEGLPLDEILEHVKDMYRRPKYSHLSRWNKVDDKGVFKDADLSREGGPKDYTIINSETGKECVVPDRGWGKSEEELIRLQGEGLIFYGDENTPPGLKSYLTSSQLSVPDSFWYFDNSVDTRWVRDAFGALVFENPKPVDMISQVIEIASQKDSVILDFFAGSGTTAHAVMNLNKSDGGSRRYIMCTLDESVKKDSEAEKAGFKTIDEIARKRIELAAEQLGDTSGLRHFRFASPSETTLEKVEDFDPTVQTLVADDMLTPFSEKSLTGSGSTGDGAATILTTWLVDDGYDFNTKAEELDLAGYKAYYAQDIARLYLIDNKGWSKESCKQLLNGLGKNEIAVNAIVIYAYSFNFVDLTELKNNLKANLDKTPQIIERY